MIDIRYLDDVLKLNLTRKQEEDLVGIIDSWYYDYKVSMTLNFAPHHFGRIKEVLKDTICVKSMLKEETVQFLNEENNIDIKEEHEPHDIKWPEILDKVRKKAINDLFYHITDLKIQNLRNDARNDKSHEWCTKLEEILIIALQRIGHFNQE